MTTTTAAKRYEIKIPAGFVLDEAASVRVGDFIRNTRSDPSLHETPGNPGGNYARVVSVSRFERGISLVWSDGTDEFSSDYTETAEIEIVTRIRHAAGFLLYRIDHPTRAGLATFVSIPEDE